MRSINILGSTGSVGQSTVNLVKSSPDQFQVIALTAQKNSALLIEQAQALNARMVAIGDETQYQAVKNALPGVQVVAGRQGILEAAAQDADWTMAAIVGCAGLEPVMTALAHSRCVAIANKEPLVAAGALVLAAAKKHGTTLLPVDSEHNAIFQVFEERNRTSIERIILTASGGPFRDWNAERIAAATPEQAVAHPNWTMGAKISVDSATLMNKGLEVIEAHHLFAMPPEQIEVIVHPQSVIHSMVEYSDGSVLAQLGAPDMRTPIAHALAWPERMATTGQRLNWAELKRLDFTPPDRAKFPALDLCYDALRAGGSACIALNAANEIAVAAFLEKRCGFSDILRVNRATLDAMPAGEPVTLDDVLQLDGECRERARALI